MNSIRLPAVLAIGFTAVSTTMLASAPAHAGFFDQLFGGAPPSRPSYEYQAQPAEPGASVDFGAPIEPRATKKVVHREEAPVRQKTTDLMHDRTLRPGDAVMMKDGVHIYNGPEAAKHSTKQFVPVETARSVSTRQKAALLALDTTRINLARLETHADTLASGRSAAVGAPISEGYRVTDPRGASVRYVGP